MSTQALAVCVFGKKSDVERLEAPDGFKEQGGPVMAEFGATRFACRMFELIKWGGEQR